MEVESGQNNRQQAKHWAGCVIPNYTEIDMMCFEVAIKPLADYWIYGKEVGENGLKHLQFMVCFKTKKTLATVKKLIQTQGHWEIKYPKSTFRSASNYCKKGEQSHKEWEELHEDGPTYGVRADYVEWGTLPPEQGSQGRAVITANYEETVALAKANRIEEINAEHYLKYYATIKKIASVEKLKIMPPDLNWRRGIDCPNDWIYGDHNTGKSMTARAENPGFYTKMTKNELWEGYDDQDCILIEDFSPFQIKMSDDIKIWADRYAFRARVLYGSLVIRPKKIVITSQYHPSEIWTDEKTLGAITDRFNIRHLVRLNKTDDSIPKKKPALKRAKINGLVNFVAENYCLRCYLHPCCCPVSIASDTEEELGMEEEEEEMLV